jgi:site-specific recombinase XerD
MSDRDIVPLAGQLEQILNSVPTIFAAPGQPAAMRFVEFFTAHIRNPNTRQTYGRAVSQFSAWCADNNLSLQQLNPFLVAAYVEHLGKRLAAPTVKQHLAAIRVLLDFLVTGQVLPMNPASSVRGPKHVVKKGKTPVLMPEEARALLDSIDPTSIAGLRDRALIGVMVFSFARVSAVIGMNVEDYFQNGKRFWIRLLEKGGKHHEVPAHHKAEEYIDAYLEAAGIAGEPRAPLFRTLERHRQLTTQRLQRREVLAMIKRRARFIGLSPAICCHTFRATGITAYLLNGGTLERAQQIAAHESPRTTKLYDRTSDEISLDEIEKILI